MHRTLIYRESPAEQYGVYYGYEYRHDPGSSP